MEINLQTGKYVAAVSGGVDSMVLLDLLAKQPGLELVVAHFNHGIRPDSIKDERLVIARAKQLKVPHEVGRGNLGKGASEEAARRGRYRFLETVQKKYKALAVITAHHQDDSIETAVINLLRGTGHRGLAAISNNKNVPRPLLNYSKADILNYAGKNRLEWRDDITNNDETYLRNYIRNNILCSLTESQRQNLISNIDKVAKNSKILNNQIAKLSHMIYQDSAIKRNDFISLPVELGNELIVFWLRELKVSNFDKKTVSQVGVALRTARSGTSHLVKDGLKIKIDRKTARFTNSL